LKKTWRWESMNSSGRRSCGGSRPEYYESFLLRVFQDKIYEEIPTAKYLYTCQIKGKLYINHLRFSTSHFI
jgi:hypothetical protein